MIRFLGRVLRRLLLLILFFAVLIAIPVLLVETMCRPQIAAADYRPILPPEHHRPESRTLLTYPEWHIVHAYDDYARVISEGDPHDYNFTRAVTQFWTSLCTLSEQTGSMGGFDTGTKQMVYVIGVSFTAELALKALYEETVGRIFTLIRGPQRSPLDDVSARQAAAYAEFLQQVPWYKWDFRRDVRELDAAETGATRDRERRFALGTEYSAKALYAGVIADAVASVGSDKLTLRMIVTGADPAALAAFDGIEVIGTGENGIEVESIRYRALTRLLSRLAESGVDFVEIAGNDDIMLTVLSPDPTLPRALLSMPRQGYGDTRHLLLVKVADLADSLRGLADGPARLEHVHDY